VCLCFCVSVCDTNEVNAMSFQVRVCVTVCMHVCVCVCVCVYVCVWVGVCVGGCVYVLV